MCASAFRALVNPYDLNDDRSVNIEDIAIASLAFGSYHGHPRWNPICDINGDDKVNLIDIGLIAKNLAKARAPFWLE